MEAARVLVLISLYLTLNICGAELLRGYEPLVLPGSEPSERTDEGDVISELPGAPESPFKMYSGYITVDENQGRALFYWFVEAVKDSSNAPVTLWLNGGPGCSSVGGGTLSELGPFYPNPDGQTLKSNEYSWNKVSNVIFLESPAGVGFSYSNDTSDYVTGDAQTSQDAVTFLVKFFAKHPNLLDNKFYIGGESYGGHYVPQLAEAVLKHNMDNKDYVINLQGFMVGNPWTDPVLDNYGAAFYWWTHAIISDATFYGITNTCNFSDIGPLRREMEEDKCDGFVASAQREMGNINIYHIYADVCTPAQAVNEARHMTQQLRGSLVQRVLEPGLSSAARGDSGNGGYDPCVDNEVEAYLNRPDVQKALHANTTDLPYRWTDCSPRVAYSMVDLFTSVLPVYRRLIKAGLRIVVFSGDVDGIVPVTGTRAWVSKLVLPIIKPWQPYIVNHQVGGYITEYEGLTFATVRHAGHMVPYTQPERALELFSYFIGEKSLQYSLSLDA